MTSRELALEAAVRFTDRARFTVDTMLKNAEKIEEWLNRDLPKLKFVNNNGAEPEKDCESWDAIKGKMREAEKEAL